LRIPWLIVNQTRLSARAAVPTALLALDVQRGGIPGDPGGAVKSVNRHYPFLQAGAEASLRTRFFTIQSQHGDKGKLVILITSQLGVYL